MRFFPPCLAALAALALLAPAAALAQETTATPAVAKRESLRFNSPIVKAVRKTKASIVTIRVPRPDGGKDLIGTGVIFDERGLIVTNRHVVGNHQRVNVRLHDDSELQGSVVFAEPRYDLAVVQIATKKDLQALKFAPVEDLEVGETVIAVGHPFGYRNTVSTGIVSALKREITMPSGDTITGLIQTDASINPGNSGGPLLNIDGELIGINVALREGAQGIAFALNAGMVKAVLGQRLPVQRVAGIDHALRGTEAALGTGGRPTAGADVGVAGSGH